MRKVCSHTNPCFGTNGCSHPSRIITAIKFLNCQFKGPGSNPGSGPLRPLWCKDCVIRDAVTGSTKRDPVLFSFIKKSPLVYSVRIPGFHPGEPGSIPGRGTNVRVAQSVARSSNKRLVVGSNPTVDI